MQWRATQAKGGQGWVGLQGWLGRKWLARVEKAKGRSKNITNLTNLTIKRFNSSLFKPLSKEGSHLTVCLTTPHLCGTASQPCPRLRCNGFGSEFISSVLCQAKGRLEVKTGGLDTLVKVNNKNLTDFFKEKNLNPVYIYENLELDTTQKKIKSETLNLSGIYLILNKITLDYYIGSAATNRFYARFSNHLFNFHGSKIVKAAVRKYKISQFAFIILELFPEVVTKENNKILLDLEDFYIKSLLPNYNILTEAGSSFGYKHTEITRINMRSNYSIERRLKIGNLNKNKNFTKETIEKMRANALTRKKPSYSEQAILNMKKKSQPLKVYNLNYTVYGEYPSITEASKSLNCNEKTIRKALKTEKKLLKKR
jgi:group I intron endonuclease